MNTIKTIQAENLRVKIYATRKEMGKAAAEDMVKVLKNLLKEKDEVNIIFAAAPSQNEFFEALVDAEGIAWNRINVFHMDEYVGLANEAPQRFGNFLKDRIFGKVSLKSTNYIDGNVDNLEEECSRYAELLKQYPTDITCMGIGENGHIAFNDPHIADFNDPKLVKVVDLDDKSRQQQVNDGCFEFFNQVPGKAITLTIPSLLAAKNIYCMVPAKTKAVAVARTITGAIDESCPASILKRHNNATMYLDKDSAELLK